MQAEKFKLTANQQLIFNLVENTYNNYLITGKPGVGKSVLIRALIEEGLKDYTLAAPTGLAALNIGGRTLHSIFRIPVSDGIIDPEFNRFDLDDRALNNIRYNVKTLIIDEVSMVRCDVFDYIDRLLRYVKGVDKPFGGIQIIIVGDFFQLPPVVRREDIPQMTAAGYKSPFVFDALVFEDNFEVLSLDEVLRQKGDNKFIDLLDKARTGSCTFSHFKALNERVGKTDGLRINLCGTNKQADQINYARLAALPELTHQFNGKKFGEWPALPVEENLNIKVGAQVMVKLNAADRPPHHRGEFPSQVVNGTLGIVEKINDPLLDGERTVDLRLANDTVVTIYSKRWERKIKEKTFDAEAGKNVWDERVVASYEQMPLVLAWAISIHKSQGQTFDRAHIDASKIFAAGQLYVALSRIKSLAGLSLETPVDARKFWADKNVMRFFKTVLV